MSQNSILGKLMGEYLDHIEVRPSVFFAGFHGLFQAFVVTFGLFLIGFPFNEYEVILVMFLVVGPICAFLNIFVLPLLFWVKIRRDGVEGINTFVNWDEIQSVQRKWFGVLIKGKSFSQRIYFLAVSKN